MSASTAAPSATSGKTRVLLSRLLPQRLRIFHDFASWLGLVCMALFLLIATVGRLVGSPDLLVTAGAESPSAAHWFGTDNLGRDVFARTASGAWTSLLISVSCVVIAVVIAVPLGMYAGSKHGKLADGFIMRGLETVQALPMFVFVLFILMLVGSAPVQLGPFTIGMEPRIAVCLALGFVPFFARIARSATLVEMQEDYVAGLRVIGIKPRHILTREVYVNVMPSVGVQCFLAIAIAIFAEGGLSFLGLGVAPPQATLGNLIADAGSQILSGSWWYAVLPGVVMVTGILGFNLVGDAFNDSLLGSNSPERA
ncbi:MAG TPA: ABC transporter permease [Candidatus Nanopelagicales bacterium]